MSKRQKKFMIAILSGTMMFQFAGCFEDILFLVAPFIV